MPASIVAGDVYARARGLLNDLDGNLFSDASLKPYLQTALDELSEMYEDNGLPLTDKATPTSLIINAGVTDIGGPTGPPLPVDLVEITALYERTGGTSQDFNLMRRMDFLPEYTIPTAYNIYWTWQQQFIHFLGATNQLEVKIEYVANVFPKILDLNTVIPIINAMNTLSFRTAGLAAEFIGENKERADSLNGQAGGALDRLMNLSIRGQQAITTRRRPFRANYKMRRQGW